MSFRPLGLGLVLVALGGLAGCVTTSPGAKPVLVMVPPYVSAQASDGVGLGKRLSELFGRAIVASGRFSLRTKGLFESKYDEALAQVGYPRTATLSSTERTALAEVLGGTVLGLVDGVLDEEGRTLRIHFRVVDAATGGLLETGFWEVPADGPESGLPNLSDWFVHPRPPMVSSPRVRLDRTGAWESGWAQIPTGEPPVAAWKVALDQARNSGAFEEALRYTDLILDRTRARESLRTLLLAEVQWAREDNDVQTLLGTLASAPGTPGEEVRLQVRFLDLVRSTAATSEARGRREVQVAFQQRFGLDLAVQLTRPSLAVVEGGTFSMGTEDGEPDERPFHSVSVSGFLMARTEVTQAQYKAITGTNPSLFLRTSEDWAYPVERVTWYDAVEFCNRMSVLDRLEPVYLVTKRNPASGYPIKAAEVSIDPSKSGYRLPSEAEWEWAARGGLGSRGTLLAGGDDPAMVAWTGGSNGGPGPVATRAPNELGLYDLSGNVWEWCSDWYGKYPWEAQVNPQGPPVGILKVGRGGSWHAAPWNARVTTRSYDNPGSRSNNLGFRVVRTLPVIP